MSIKEIKNALIELYLGAKIRNLDDMNNLSDEILQNEKKALDKLPALEIINYISNSLDIISEIKASEKYDEKLMEDEKREKYINKENEEDANGLKLYEGMLVKAESEIRAHIGVSDNIL